MKALRRAYHGTHFEEPSARTILKSVPTMVRLPRLIAGPYRFAEPRRRVARPVFGPRRLGQKADVWRQLSQVG